MVRIAFRKFARCAVLAVMLVAALATPSAYASKQVTRSGTVRTLKAINIEGEIAVPQVLFITTRDYPRFRDGLGLNFRMRSRDVAHAMHIPDRLRVVAKTTRQKED